MNLIDIFVMVTLVCCVGCSDNTNQPLQNAKLSDTVNDSTNTSEQKQTTHAESRSQAPTTLEASTFDTALALMGNVYTAFWLFSDSDEHYEPLLLLTRVPFKKLLAESKLKSELGHAPENDADRPPLLESSALCLNTYLKDSIWNNDRRPIKAIGVVTGVDNQKNSITIDGLQYRAEEASVSEVINLLEAPEGNELLHRRHAPLAGAEQTARALILLLKNQLKQPVD